MDDENNPITEMEQSQPAPRILTPEAQRALAEAAQRRALADQQRANMPKEVNGRGGLEPVRYGDWEINGLISDF
jgi:hypothetical protein